MKPTIKYLLNGEYHYATVKDIGDIEKLTTAVRTDLVSAINSLSDGVGSIPPDLLQQVEELESQLLELSNGNFNEAQLAKMQTIMDASVQAMDADLQLKLDGLKQTYDARFEQVTSDYDQKVLDIQGNVTGLKNDLDATEQSLVETGEKLSGIELNYTTVSETVDLINGQLSTKVESSDFELLESTVNAHETEITQTKESISLMADKESLDLANGQITDMSAELEVQAGQIASTVKKEELKQELEGLEIYAPNILEGTTDWNGWTSINPSNAYVLSDTYQHTQIQEQLGFGAYEERNLTGLTVGKTYIASVWGKSTNIKAQPVFKINGVNNIMLNINKDSFMGAEWQRFSVKFVASATSLKVSFTTISTVSGDKSHFSGGKVEIGTVNTGWRPNESDSHNRVVSAESSIRQQADQIVSVVTEQEKIGEDVTEHTTSINQLSESIELQATGLSDIEGKVSANEASIKLNDSNIKLKVEQNDIDKSVEGIKLDIRNGVLNSDFQRDFADWTSVNAEFKIVEISGKKYAKITRYGLSANTIAAITTNKMPAVKGDRLMIGFDMIVDDLSKYDVKTPAMLELFDISDVRVDFRELTMADLKGSLINGKPGRLSTNYTISRDDVAKASLRLNLYRNGSVAYTNASLQKGDIGSTEWIPAPEDSQLIQASLKTEIDQAADAITLKASTETVNKLSGDLAANTASLKVANDAITAHTQSLTKVDGKISEHEAKLVQTSESLSSKITATEVDDLLEDKGYATQSELKQTADGFELIVGSAREDAEKALQEYDILKDKTEILSGNPIYTNRADDAVVHVGVDGKSEQVVVEGNPNLLVHSSQSEMVTVTNPKGQDTWEKPISRKWWEHGVQLKSNTSYVLSFDYKIDWSGAKGKPLADQIVGVGIGTASGVEGAYNADTFSITADFSLFGGNYDSGHFSYKLTGNGGYFAFRALRSELVDLIGVKLTISKMRLEESGIETPMPIPSPDYPSAINSLDKSFDIVSSAGSRNYLEGSNFMVEATSSTRAPLKSFGVTAMSKDELNKTFLGKVIRLSYFVNSVGARQPEVGNGLGNRFGIHGIIQWEDSSGQRANITDYPFAGALDGVYENKRIDLVTTVTPPTGYDRIVSISFSFQPYAKPASSNNEVWKLGQPKLEIKDLTPYSPAPEDITHDTQSPTIYKTNILLSEPLRSVGDVKDRVFLDTDGLWKVERNVGESNLKDTGISTTTPFGEGNSYHFGGSVAFIITLYGNEKTKLITKSVKKILSSHFTYTPNNNYNNKGASDVYELNSITRINGEVYSRLFIRVNESLIGAKEGDSVDSLVSKFSTWVNANNPNILYELATPIIETLSAEQQTKLNNIASFKGSNYVYTVANVTPNLRAQFKSAGWTSKSGIKDVTNSLDNLEDITLPALSDGLLNKSEKEAIKQSLNIVESEKKGFDSQYNSVYANASLIGSQKTNLYNSKVAYDTAQSELKAAINAVLAITDGVRISVQLTAKVETEFSDYGIALGILNQRLQEALDAISGKKSADAEANAIAHTTAQLVIRDDMISSRVEKTDYTGAKVASLINQSADTVKIAAKNIDINGAVTFSSFDTATKAAIDDKASKNEAQGYANSAVNEVQFGVTNIFRNSGQFTTSTNYWHDNGGGLALDSNTKYLGFNTIRTTVGAGMSGEWYKLETNVEYTYSLMVKSNNVWVGTDNLPIHYWAGINNVHTNSIHVISHDTGYTASDVGKWKKVWLTFKLIGDANSFRPFIYFGSGTTIMNIGYFKLEKGNKATDWSPAPEDYTETIDAIEVGATNLWVNSETTSAYNLNSINFEPSTDSHQVMKNLIDVRPNENLLYQVWNPNRTVNHYNANRVSFFNGSNVFLSNIEVPALNGDEYQTQLMTVPLDAYKARLGTIQGGDQGVKDQAIKIKFEKGNKATGYTPAPKDVENAYTNVAQAKASLAETNAKAHADGKISNEEARAIADAQAKLAAAQGYADNAVKDLEIGGGNIVLKSNTPQTRIGAGWITWELSKFFDSGEHTVTIEYENTIANGGGLGMGTSTGYDGHYFDYPDAPQGRGTYTKTFILTKSVENTHLNYWVNNNTTVTRIKLEKGSKATDWSPAPEDIQNSLDSINGKINNAVTTIDGSGVTVKDGSFFLEDANADTKYSIVSQDNMVLDHSFEMIGNREDLNYKTVLSNYMAEDSGSDWQIIGSPELIYGSGSVWDSVNAKQATYNKFGEKSVNVNNSNYVRTLQEVALGGKYTFSAYFRSPLFKTAAGQPRIKVTQVSARDETKDLGTFTFPELSASDKETWKRHTATFTATGATNGGAAEAFIIEIMSANANYINVDGVQIVEGSYPTIYAPEQGAWEMANGNMPSKEVNTGDVNISRINGAIRFPNQYNDSESSIGTGYMDALTIDAPAGVMINSNIAFSPNKYAGAGGAINLANGDIIGINSLFFNDVSSAGEGLFFPKSSTPSGSTSASDYDSFFMNEGDAIYNGVRSGDVLWTGATYLNDSQSATPTKKLSECPNGWILVWSVYTGGVTKDYDWNQTYVHKSHAKRHNGQALLANLTQDGNRNVHLNKYLYVFDNKINGYASNGTAPDNILVLREVIAW